MSDRNYEVFRHKWVNISCFLIFTQCSLNLPVFFNSVCMISCVTCICWRTNNFLFWPCEAQDCAKKTKIFSMF